MSRSLVRSVFPLLLLLLLTWVSDVDAQSCYNNNYYCNYAGSCNYQYVAAYGGWGYWCSCNTGWIGEYCNVVDPQYVAVSCWNGCRTEGDRIQLTIVSPSTAYFSSCYTSGYSVTVASSNYGLSLGSSTVMYIDYDSNVYQYGSSTTISIYWYACEWQYVYLTTSFPGFAAPQVSSFGCNPCYTSGAVLTFTGYSFGSSSWTPYVNLQQPYGALSTTWMACYYTISHYQVVCNSIAGQGPSIPAQLYRSKSPYQAYSSFYYYGYYGPSISGYNCGGGSCPTTGAIALTIFGSNFAYDGSQDSVYVAGSASPSTVFSTSYTELVVSLPELVTASYTTSFSVYVATQLATYGFYYASPSLSSVTCVAPCNTAGSTVSLVGSNFGRTGASVIATTAYGGYSLGSCSQVTGSEHTNIVCTSVMGQGTALGLAVSRSNPSASSGYVYFGFLAPTISAASCPSVGCNTDGTSLLTITGANFGYDASQVYLTYWGLTNVGPTSINAANTVAVFSVPELTATTALTLSIVLHVADQTASSPLTYAPLTVSSVACSSPCNNIGSALTVAGTNFGHSGLILTLSAGQSPTGCVHQPGSLHTLAICTGFAGAGSGIGVTVTRPATTSSVTGYSFSYAPPVIVAYSCTTFSSTVDNSNCKTDGTATLYITGTNLGAVSANLAAIYVEGTWLTASLTWNSTTEVSVGLPAGPGTDRYLQVQIANQDSQLFSFNYAALTVSSANCGGTTCGTTGATLTISGTNFGKSVPTVTFSVSGFSVTNPSSCSGSQVLLTCTGFSGASTGISVTLVRILDASTASTTFSFTAPDITAFLCTGPPAGISSSVGCNTDGTATLFIEGANFGGGLAGNLQQVTVQGTVVSGAAVTYSSDYQLSLPLPVGTSSTVTLSLLVGGQTSNVVTFRYASPTISSAVCSGVGGSCSTVGATLLISGTNFGQSVPVVTIGKTGIITSNPTFCAGNQVSLSCSGFTGASTAVTVTVSRVDGLSAADIFSFTAPSLSSYSCSPECGTAGTSLVTMVGLNFGPALGNFDYADVSGHNCLASASLAVPQTTLVCTLPVGPEASNFLVVSVGGQVSNSFGFSYASPRLTAAGCASGGTGVCATTGATLTLVGANFGQYEPHVVLSSPNAYVQQQPGFNNFAANSPANDCFVSDLAGQTEIHCINFKGAGTNIGVNVTRIDAANVSLGSAFSYGIPAISSFLCTEATAAKQYGNNCSTDGTAVVTFVGTNFPIFLANWDSLTVGNGSARPECTNKTVLGDFSISCVLPEGPQAGTNYFALVVGGQSATSIPPFAYAAPFIASVNCGGGGCNTFGDTVTITGLNLGKERPALVQSLGSYSYRTTYYGPAIDCAAIPSSLNDPQREFACVNFEGAGAGVLLTLTRLDGQSTSGTFSYNPPTITSFWCATGSGGLASLQGSGSLLSPGNAFCRTDGTASITFYGTNFGFAADHVEAMSVGGDFGGTGGESSCFASAQLFMTDMTADRSKYIRCTLPEMTTNATVTMNLDVQIAGQKGRDSGVFRYRAPTVARAYCGGSNPDEPWFAPNPFDSTDAFGETCRTVGDTLTVFGDDFGPSGTVGLFSQPIGHNYTVSPRVLCLHDPHSTLARHRTLFCSSGFYGVGTAIGTVALRLDTQQSAIALSSFSFAPPRIDSLGCYNRSGDVQTCNTDINIVTITGVNFGSVTADINNMTIGGLSCRVDPNWVSLDPLGETSAELAHVVVGHEHFQISCRTPLHSGAGLPVVVTVGGQPSSFNGSFSYQPPSITHGGQSCSYSDAWNSGNVSSVCGTHDTILTIRGNNFGSYTDGSSVLSASVGLLNCPIYLRSSETVFPISHHEIYCQLPEQTGINFNISLTVSGQSTVDPGVFDYAAPVIHQILCPSRPDWGTYGADPTHCGTEGGVLTVRGDHFGLRTDQLTVTLTNLLQAAAGPSAAAVSPNVCIPGQSDCNPILCTPLSIDTGFAPPNAPLPSYAGNLEFQCLLPHGYGSQINMDVMTAALHGDFNMSFVVDPIYSCLLTNSLEHDNILYVELFAGAAGANNGSGSTFRNGAVDMVRDAIFAGYNASNIIGIIEPYLAASQTSSADAGAKAVADATAALAPFVAPANQNPSIPLLNCYFRISDPTVWTAQQAWNYASLLAMIQYLETTVRVDPTYPRCVNIGFLTWFSVFRTVFGNPDGLTPAPYLANHEWLSYPLIYWNDNGGLPGTTNATFMNNVDDTLPGPVGENLWNYYGWARSQNEAFPKDALSYTTSLAGIDPMCPALSIPALYIET